MRNTTWADAEKSIFKITNEEEIDLELNSALLKCKSLGILVEDIVNQFGLSLGKRVAEQQHQHNCLNCGGTNTFNVVISNGLVDWHCSQCNLQKKYGRCLIGLLQSYLGEDNASRNIVMSTIRTLIATKQRSPRQSAYAERRAFMKKMGIYPITKPITKPKTKKIPTDERTDGTI